MQLLAALEIVDDLDLPALEAKLLVLYPLPSAKNLISLHLVCPYGMESTVRALMLSRGVPALDKIACVGAPLITACCRGQTEIAGLLLLSGAAI